MLPLLHVVRVQQRLSVFAQLRLEEALLRSDARCWCLLNAGGGGGGDGAACAALGARPPPAPPRAIVMGISGVAASLVDVPAARAAAVPVIRRFSGGGTVLVDGGTLLVSLICGAEAAAAGGGGALAALRHPREIMAWSAAAVYAPALAAALAPRAPPFALREHDYALGERKFGGNAQSLSRGRWVHHSSLLWTMDAPAMAALLRLPERRPEYRASRAHADFLTPLSAHVAAAAAEAQPPAAAGGEDALPPQLRGGHDFHPGAAALFPHLLRALAASFRLVDVPLEEALSVAHRPQERVGTHYVDL